MDSTGDWPKDFQELKTIDALLRCPICYEYMDAAVSLRTCLHSFCSVCVRRYLSKYQKDCPQCHQVAAESDLVANRGLGELISKFRAVRGRLLEAVRVASVGGSSALSSVTGTSTTAVVRPQQPVAVQATATAAAAPGGRHCSIQATAFAARPPRRGNAMSPPAARRVAAAADDFPNTYVFSEPWDNEDHGDAAESAAQATAASGGATAASSSSLLHGGGASVDRVSVLSDSQEAAVPLPPMSMPDTQQILDDDSFSNGVVVAAAVVGAGNRADCSRSASDSAAGATLRAVPAPASLASAASSLSASALSSAPAVTENSAATAVATAQDQDLADRVPCPVCSALIPSRSVNSHLDRCLSQEGQKPRLHVDTAAFASTTTAAAVSSSVTSAVPAPLTSTQHEPLASVDSRAQVFGGLMASAANTAAVGSSRKPMPRLVYSLLGDKQLRKHLKDCGLPTLGSKQTMIKRHQEFVLRYNADADSSNPRTAVEIAKALEDEERVRGMAAAPLSRGMPAPSQKPLRFASVQSAEDKNKLRNEYAVQHQSQFSHLIDEVRHRRHGKPGDPPPAPAPALSPRSERTPSSRGRVKGNAASASPPVRASPRPAKTRSSPRGQPPAKKRRSTRKMQLALSDDDDEAEAEEAVASGSDTDVDPRDFAPHGHASQKKRRSSRRRAAVRRSYLELASTDDDDDLRPVDDGSRAPEEPAAPSRALFERRDSTEGDPAPLPERMRVESSDSAERRDSPPASRRRAGRRRSNGQAALSASDDDFRPFNNESVLARTRSPPSGHRAAAGRRIDRSSFGLVGAAGVIAPTVAATTVRPGSVCNGDVGSGEDVAERRVETGSTGHGSRRGHRSDECSDATAEYNGCSDATAEYLRSDDDGPCDLQSGESSAVGGEVEGFSQSDSLPMLTTDDAGVQQSSGVDAVDHENPGLSDSQPLLANDAVSGLPSTTASGMEQDLSQSDSQPLLAATIESPGVENGQVRRDSFFGSLSSAAAAAAASLCDNHAMAFDDNAETQFPGASSPESSGVALQQEVNNGLFPQILAEETQMDSSPDRKVTRGRRKVALLHSTGSEAALRTTCVEETQGFASPPGATFSPPLSPTLTRRSLRCRR